MMTNSNDLIKKLGFPLIAKSLMADGSETSHKMYLVFDKEGLDKLESRMIIMQEFVNHDGVIFKVYVVDDFVKCVKRKLLPDIKEDKLVTLKGLLSFSQISNLEEKTDCGGGGEFDRVEMPLMDFVEEVAKAMKEETETSLLNFDVIRDVRDANRYLIIDINYFPGYEKIPNYVSVLTEFLLNSMEKNKSGDVNMVLLFSLPLELSDCLVLVKGTCQSLDCIQILSRVKEARTNVSEKLAKMYDEVLNAYEESKDLEKVLKDLTK
ncbi:hypothetical protein POTOM_059153 [Populus tomentosa]|uniref:Inositol 1,3,4-trisphosphate 5/6-kinase ATP-grasp domain-containing protein n=1 Tax=Populus tomentosa TaxID=118781 RepID=A0A8X7XTM0_POPTO|nr:hypothetical protein POTOM_059153 [Populus tomentosa]